MSVTRREFLAGTGVAIGATFSNYPLIAERRRRQRCPARPRVAAIFTELRFRSHAYNILENFLGPYLFNGQKIDPGVDVVSFYADQFPENDMARDVSKKFAIPLYKSIDEALCNGGNCLDVDAVLAIGEHGDYPLNDLGQRMYPRKEFFDQSLAVMKRSGRFVPYFNDKHLSYRWDWSKEMYDASREFGFPLMAGSSVPLAQRVPNLQLPPNAKLHEAVSIHGGGLESYDFHGLEVLQSFVEARQGGEAGISSIQVLQGERLQRAISKGEISQGLITAAMNAEKTKGVERQPRPALKKVGFTQQKQETPAVGHALLIKYKDGFKASVLKVGSSSNRWNFACKVHGDDKIKATALYNGPWGNRNLFKALSHGIQHLFIHQEEPYPVERTLLVSGVLESAMISHQQNGKLIKTPQLELPYQPIDFREMRESGSSWKVITKDVPQPAGFEPGSDPEPK